MRKIIRTICIIGRLFAGLIAILAAFVIIWSEPVIFWGILIIIVFGRIAIYGFWK